MTDYKEVSLNVKHSSLEITDQFYSNINDTEVKNRISTLRQSPKSKDQDDLALIKEFLEWKRNNKIHK